MGGETTRWRNDRRLPIPIMSDYVELSSRRTVVHDSSSHLYLSSFLLPFAPPIRSRRLLRFTVLGFYCFADPLSTVCYKTSFITAIINLSLACLANTFGSSFALSHCVATSSSGLCENKTKQKKTKKQKRLSLVNLLASTDTA